VEPRRLNSITRNSAASKVIAKCVGVWTEVKKSPGEEPGWASVTIDKELGLVLQIMNKKAMETAKPDENVVRL